MNESSVVEILYNSLEYILVMMTYYFRFAFITLA